MANSEYERGLAEAERDARMGIDTVARYRRPRHCRVCGGYGYLPPETNRIEDNGRECPYCGGTGRDDSPPLPRIKGGRREAQRPNQR